MAGGFGGVDWAWGVAEPLPHTPSCMSAASRAHRRAWVSGGVWWRQRPLALVSVLRGPGRTWGCTAHGWCPLARTPSAGCTKAAPAHTQPAYEHRQPGPRSCMGEVVIVNVASSPRPYQRDQRPCGGGTARATLRLACVLGLGCTRAASAHPATHERRQPGPRSCIGRW